jgi:hypothetical protein
MDKKLVTNIVAHVAVSVVTAMAVDLGRSYIYKAAYKYESRNSSKQTVGFVPNN